MNKAKNPYTERTVIFSAVLIIVGGIIAQSYKFISVEYLSEGLYITGQGISIIGLAMCVFVLIMECKYGQ